MASSNSNNSHDNSGHTAVVETALTTLLPIRDLAKNWDIDIAACLDEYLQDLELSQETREHVAAQASSTNSTNTNFCQAALVLQNSSGIYSRKVDYLHTFCYQVQQVIQQQQQRNSQTAQKGSTKSAPLQEFLDFDPHQEFLLLDDVLPTVDKDRKRKTPRNNDDEDDLHSDDDDNEALGEVHDTAIDLPLPPRVTDGSTSDATAWTPSRRQSLGATAGWNENRTTPSATMLLQASQQQQYSHYLNASQSHQASSSWQALGGGSTLRLATQQQQSGGTMAGRMHDNGVLVLPGAGDSREPRSHEGAGNADEDAMDDFGGGGYDMDDGDDDDKEGLGFAMNNDYDNMVTDTMDATEGTEASKKVTFASGTTDPLPRPVSATPREEPPVDPWALLDRDTPDGAKARPLRIGKTIVLPPSVDEPPSACVTGSRTRTRAATARSVLPQSSPWNHQSVSWAVTSSRGTPVPLQGLAYGNEFVYLRTRAMKRQAAVARRSVEGMRTGTTTDDADDGTGMIQRQREYADHTDNNDSPFDFGGGDEDDDHDFGGSGGWDNDEQDATGGGLNSNTGLASLDDVYRRNDVGDDNDNDSRADTRTFEELCRAHIRAFARGAEKYAAETKLSTRVGHWQDRLLPRLQDEETRPVFDIHAYGTNVLETMQRQIAHRTSLTSNTAIYKENGVDGLSKASSNKEDSALVDFGTVTEQCESYDVCRMFLASLSLVNAGNVNMIVESSSKGEMVDDDDDSTRPHRTNNEPSLDRLQLQLVRRNLERPMDVYLAPSVADATVAAVPLS